MFNRLIKKQDDEPNSPNNAGETVKNYLKKSKTSDPGVDTKCKNKLDKSQKDVEG